MSEEMMNNHDADLTLTQEMPHIQTKLTNSAKRRERQVNKIRKELAKKFGNSNVSSKEFIDEMAELKKQNLQLKDENELLREERNEQTRLKTIITSKSKEIEQLNLTILSLKASFKSEIDDCELKTKEGQMTEEAIYKEMSEWRKTSELYQYVTLPEKEREITQLKSRLEKLLAENKRIIEKNQQALEEIKQDILTKDAFQSLKDDFKNLNAYVEDMSVNLATFVNENVAVKTVLIEHLKQKIVNVNTLQEKLLIYKVQLIEKNRVLEELEKRLNEMNKNYLYFKNRLSNVCESQDIEQAIKTVKKSEETLKSLEQKIRDKNIVLRSKVAGLQGFPLESDTD